MSKNWAICIGINDYYNLQSLNYAVQDAESIRDFFLNEVQFEQVYYFSDSSPRIETPRGLMRSLPTFANLKRFFRERFQRSFLNVGDNFWFFFAGHGELHEGHDYLMPIDVDPENLEETAIRISDITAYLRNCGADNTVLLLDACRSQGRRRGQGFGVEEQQGIVTIYSCSPRESSYEITELEHGSFTYALLEGFRLQGAQNCATVERLDQYLRYEVPELNQRYNKPSQTPYTAVEPLSKNCLILLPQQATLQDVQALKNTAYRAELEADLTFAQQLWIRCLAASPADQDAVAAIGRIAIKQNQQASGGPTSPPATAGSRSIATSVTEVPAAPPPHEESADRLQVFTAPPVSAPVEAPGDTQGSALPRREELGNGVSLELVPIPGGSFLMGSPDGEGRDSERPQHKVTVKPFLMGKYLVTQTQWKAVVALPKVERDLKADPFQFKGDHRPVECVSWEDAVEFCQRLSKQTGREYRLPSEAEWEYACRARTTTPYYFGDTLTSDQANYRTGETTDVGSFPANAWGLHDMHGNVWEWCLDHWHDNYEGAPTDGSAWTKGGGSSRRVLRGGSWDVYPDYCRSAYRLRYARDFGIYDDGFRVVCASSWTL
ncbi:SUMF1/EgtB/PvdO family nonheme iron enzyme [Leptothoe sp. LEGE 181152]|nr:SUMF1/EgtB/PvdO family nonheme iron enzyme [Leptothoe sp. LEGE 181152]